MAWAARRRRKILLSWRGAGAGCREPGETHPEGYAFYPSQEGNFREDIRECPG